MQFTTITDPLNPHDGSGTMLHTVLKGSVPLPAATRADSKIMHHIAALMQSSARSADGMAATLLPGSLILKSPRIILYATAAQTPLFLGEMEDRLEEAETLMAALAIIRTAGLELDGKLPVLSSEFARYLIAPSSSMLVVPSTATRQDDRPRVANAMRISRCDAVIVQIVRPTIGPKKVVVDIGIDGLIPVWYDEYRPCSLDGVLHFVPDHDPVGPIFRLTQKGLTSSVDFDVLQIDEH